MVAMSDGALVDAVTLPYGAPGSGSPVSARALQMRPPSAPHASCRLLTLAAGVQAVVVPDLSAQYETTHDPIGGETVGVARVAVVVTSVAAANASEGLADETPV